MKRSGLIILISLFFNLHLLNAQCLPANTFIEYYEGTQTTAELGVYNATTGGTYYIEYGLAGFTPGTAGTPGPGGTLVAVPVAFPNTNGSVIVSGLTANTVYDVYNRKNCSGVWSSNSPLRIFMTAIDCSSIPTISCNALITTQHPVGYGAWITGTCINGGAGFGAERIFSFTPSFTGMHKLYIPANSNIMDYVYKPASGGCTYTNWTCIGSNNWYNYEPGQFSFGPLTAGVPYFIRADPGYHTAPQQTSVFRIECPVLNCSEVTNVNAINISTNKATVTWTGAGSCIVEYGPSGFIPGTGFMAGPNGTIATYGSSGSYTISGLNTASYYDVYVRKDCGSGSYSPNSNFYSFATLPCPEVYNYTSFGSFGSIFWYGQPGIFDPQYCAFGAPMPGEEKILRFTAPSSGYLDLEVQNNLSAPSQYNLYLTQNCNLDYATCLYGYTYSYSNLFYAVGPLVAGQTYDILIDVDDTTHSYGFDYLSFNLRCPKPTTVNASDFQPNSVTINWSCNYYTPCQSPPYLEYGPEGFIPGTGATAGTNGTLISGVTSPYTITGLQPYTKYDVYMRTSCGGNFSTNTARLTVRTSVDCSTSPDVGCSSYLSFSVSGPSNANNGSWNSQACGSTNYLSKESVWKFTPSQSGSYSLYIYHLTAGSSSYTWPASFYIKPETLGCNELNWTCAGTINQNLLTFTPATISLGNLTAGTTYLIMADGIQPTFTPGYTYFFRIECPGVCTGPLLGTPTATNSTATINGTCPACIGTLYLEYGPAGFTPGTDATPGAGGTIIAGATFPVLISGLTAGTTYDVYARNDCGSPMGFSPNSVKRTVTPCYTSPTGITSNVPGNSICSGSSITLTQVGGVLPPGGIFKWYSGTCGSIVAGTGNDITVSPTTTTTYRVQIESSCGTSNCNTWLTVSVSTTSPAITASGPTSFCPGGSVVLTANSGTGYTYQWKNGGIDIPGATNISYTASTSGNYTVVVTNTTGCAQTSAPTTVTLNTNPIVSFSGLASTYSNTDPAATLTGSPLGGTFSGPGISGNTFSPAVAGIGGPYTITYSYTDGNGCSGSASAQTSVTGCTAPPAQPGAITTVGGTATVCPGDTKTYTINPVAGASSYNWTPPAGSVITSGQGTVSVTIDYTASFTVPDSLKVVALNNCGTSPQRAIKIFRNNPTTPSVITGEAYGLCNINGVPYAVTPVAGMTYNWSFSKPNGTVASGQGTNSITADMSGSFTTMTVSVTASNACGTSIARTLTLRSKPATPASITGPLSVCANQQGVPYSITPLYGVNNYTWTGPKKSKITDGVVISNNTTLITTASSVAVNYGNSGGILKVRGNNGCGSGAYKSVTITMNCRQSMVQDAPSDFKVSLYPNPAREEINVSISISGEFEIEIFNLIGEKMHNSQNKSKIDLSDYPAGLYFMRITSGEHKAMEKFIVE